MRSRDDSERSELNLLPMMNLVSLLIPLLLMGTQLVALSAVEVTQPASAPIGDVDPDELHLVVAIEPTGFVVQGAEDVLGEASLDLPCASACAKVADWPAEELQQRLAEIKAAHPTVRALTVLPDARIDYQTIIRTMDVSREHKVAGETHELFPIVSIAAR
ncbi:MAG: biopolymer transporter ExbD [Proteobacteria bacterium]|nr:biopolymer transporter ExbD [Pseudomonadota bacterium]